MNGRKITEILKVVEQKTEIQIERLCDHIETHSHSLSDLAKASASSSSCSGKFSNKR